MKIEILYGKAAEPFGLTSERLNHALPGLCKNTVETFYIALLPIVHTIILDAPVVRKNGKEMVFELNAMENLYFERCRVKRKGATAGVRGLIMSSSANEHSLKKNKLEILSSCDLEEAYNVEGGEELSVELGGSADWWLAPDDPKVVPDLEPPAQQPAKNIYNASALLEKLADLRPLERSEMSTTIEVSEDLLNLVYQIDHGMSAVGSILVGLDGQVLANTLPPRADAESLAVWALGLFMNTEHVAQKLGRKRVLEIICKTPQSFIVVGDFGGGILVTITDSDDLQQIMRLRKL